MTEDQKRIHAIELENVSLRKRVLILEGANNVLSKRILPAIDLITKGDSRRDPIGFQTLGNTNPNIASNT